MAVSKRLTLLGALSVTKPRGIGSSYGLINRRQFCNLTEDAKFGSESSKPKVSPDQDLPGFMKEAKKFEERALHGNERLREAVYSLREYVDEHGKKVTADTALASKQFDKLWRGTLLFLGVLAGGAVLAKPYIRPRRSSTHDDQSKPLCAQCSKTNMK